MSTYQKGQSKLPAPASSGLEYFVHGIWMRGDGDDANNKWAGWASLRVLRRHPIAWDDIEAAIEDYEELRGEAHAEAREAVEEEEATAAALAGAREAARAAGDGEVVPEPEEVEQ
jgi:hypothetical protein